MVQLFRITLGVLVLFQWAVAQPNELISVTGDYRDGVTELVFTLKEEPDPQVFFTDDFANLAVEFPHTNQTLVLPGRTTDYLYDPPRGLVNWSLDYQFQHNYRANFLARLSHPPEPGSLEIEILENPWRTVVRFRPDYQWRESFPLADGVVWHREVRAQANRFLEFLRLDLDFSRDGLELDVGLPSNGVTFLALDKMWEAGNGEVALNGLRFDNLGNLTPPLIREGETLIEGPASGPVVVFTDGARCTLQDDPTLPSNTSLAFRACDRFLPDMSQTSVNRPGNYPLSSREARTALGLKPDGKVVLMTATGYREAAGDGNDLPRRYEHRPRNQTDEGATLGELAEAFSRVGATEAVTLTGGPNTQMWISRRLVSRPVSPGPLPQAAAFVLKMPGGGSYPARVLLESVPKTLPADGSTLLTLRGRVAKASGEPASDVVVRLFASRLRSASRVAKTDGEGRFEFQLTTPKSTGPGKIRVECGPAFAETETNLMHGTPYAILARRYKGASYHIQVIDRHCNIVPRQTLTVNGREVSTGEGLYWGRGMEKVLIQGQGLESVELPKRGRGGPF